MALEDFGMPSMGGFDATLGDVAADQAGASIGSSVGSNLAGEITDLTNDNADRIKSLDDTWFTPDRMKAIKNAAKQDDFQAPGLNLPAAGQVAMAQHPGIAPMQPMAMPNMQVKHGALGAPLQHFRRGGALPQMKLKTFAGGGSMSHALPMMMASLHDIRHKLSNVQPQVKRAVPIGQQHGPGTGRSDSIHSAFADGGKVATGDGEYVIPADTVSYLGDGSSDAGARVLDAFVQHTRGLHQKALGALPPPRRGR